MIRRMISLLLGLAIAMFALTFFAGDLFEHETGPPEITAVLENGTVVTLTADARLVFADPAAERADMLVSALLERTDSDPLSIEVVDVALRPDIRQRGESEGMRPVSALGTKRQTHLVESHRTT